MRSAKAQDYWAKVYKRKFPKYIEKIDLNGLNGISDIAISKGIFAICGLNGAGKSTIVSAIKDVIGISRSEYDKHRLGSAEISAMFHKEQSVSSYKNIDGHRLLDNEFSSDQICYLDCALNTSVQNYIVELNDLGDILDQYEEVELTTDEVEELNHIVGKHYSSCAVRMIENEDGSDSIPYCKVNVGDVDYDSRGMGSGEHFLFYIYLRIKEIKPGSILIIEEPETYISIVSQIRLVDYLAKQIAEKGICVILSTHSPYILKCIKNENIRVVSRLRNTVRITTPDAISAESILGLSSASKGTFFVEDRIACDYLSVCLEDFMPSVLREYTIDIVNGEAEISNRLQFPKSVNIKYQFIGVYDGDMRQRLNTVELNWPYCFLPGDEPIEKSFINFAEEPLGVSALSTILNKDEAELFHLVSSLEGTDYHDWFEELRKMLGIDGKALVRAFYYCMKDQYLKPNDFMEELLKLI